MDKYNVTFGDTETLQIDLRLVENGQPVDLSYRPVRFVVEKRYTGETLVDIDADTDADGNIVLRYNHSLAPGKYAYRFEFNETTEIRDWLLVGILNIEGSGV